MTLLVAHARDVIDTLAAKPQLRFHRKVAFSTQSMIRCYYFSNNSNEAHFVDSSYVESGLFFSISKLFIRKEILTVKLLRICR